jgi:photosystem II stability/assembly factor-like uncharacterized protein
MSDEQDRELLEQERRRFRMGDDSYRRLERRRDRKRRNRMITSGVLALVIAAAGGTGVVLAFRNTGTEAPSATTPPPTASGPAPTPISSPTGAPVAAFVAPPSGSIEFVNEELGWLVSDGQIQATTDGGKTWAVQYSGPLQISAIQFSDAEHGWAISVDQRLLQTVDGGATWSDTTDSHSPLFRSVQFLRPDAGWAITGDSSASGHLVVFTNDGPAWAPVETPVAPDSLCFAGPDAGWVAGGNSVLRTTDSGKHWTQTDLGVPQGEPWTSTLACAGPDEAWVLLSDGGAAGHLAHAVFHSGDGGKSWQAVLQDEFTSPLGADQAGVYASSDPYPGPLAAAGAGSLVFVTWCPACGSGSISALRTTDGGATWERVDVAGPDGGGDPSGSSFVDPLRGWIVFTSQASGSPKTTVAVITWPKVTLSDVS